MRRNIRFSTKIKMLNCYVCSLLKYGCDYWTWNKAMCKKINAFEMWCYRRMLKISWRDRVTNKAVLNRMQTKLHFMEDMMRRKLKYAGHVMRGLGGMTHLQILEGKIEGKKKVGRPRRIWIDDVLEWAEQYKYLAMKSLAEDRESWRSLAGNLRYESDEKEKETIKVHKDGLLMVVNLR